MPARSLSLTVGLPVFNDANGLRKSIPSVFRQDWPGEIRILVVDDGSTDETPAALRQLSKSYPNVVVLRNEINRGRATARNQILDYVDTEYLAWIDSDDVWLPYKVRRQFDVLRAREDDRGVLCTCPYRLVWIDSGQVTTRRSRLHGDQLKNCLDTTLYPYLWTMLGRTETFRAIGRFDERLRRRQDFDFVLRFVASGGLIVSSDPDIPLCEYYRSDVGRSGWEIERANRRIWKRHRKLYTSYSLSYAYACRAAQHSMTARFFRANGREVLKHIYVARAALNSAVSRAVALTERRKKEHEGNSTGAANPSELKFAIFGKGVTRPPPPVRPLVTDSIKRIRTDDTVAREPDDFLIYRIIGNDLPPRHAEGQALRNLEFILSYEPAFPGCEKRWIVNRVSDPIEERRIIELLNVHRQPYVVIPFDINEYRRTGLDFTVFPEPGLFWPSRYRKLGRGDMRRMKMHAFRLKNIYTMNNNGARNLALEDGRLRAKWIMPWDGNCFLTKEGWEQVRRQVCDAPHYKYVLVPMARINDNHSLLSPIPAPVANEEPQVIFRRDARERFNEAWPYGRRPKVELFWRLGVPWKSEHWVNQPWDPEVSELSPEAGQYQFAGWVARLSSGKPEYEQSNRTAFLQRGIVREESIIAALTRLDESFFTPGDDGAAISAEALVRQTADPAYSRPIASLISEADEALNRGPYSVVEKGAATVGTLNDYWFPAPYWWPNPKTLNGRPYVRVEGKRQPGTKLYEEGSERYDRERLQRLCDDTLVLALAFRVTGQIRYAQHARKLLRCWFIDDATRMNPHLKYAEVRLGHDNDHGNGRGVIQSQCFWYLLEAVRLLESADSLEEFERQEIKSWFEQYLTWLLQSRQGRWAKARTDFHGAYYELQIAAIAAFIDAADIYVESTYRIEEKMHHQFKGLIRDEERATDTQAQIARVPSTLIAWSNLHYLSRACGADLWEIDTVRGLIRAALDRFFEEIGHGTRGGETYRVAAPLCCAYVECFGEVPPGGEGVFDDVLVDSLEPSMHGVRPFWMLGVDSDPRFIARMFPGESSSLRHVSA